MAMDKGDYKGTNSISVKRVPVEKLGVNRLGQEQQNIDNLKDYMRFYKGGFTYDKFRFHRLQLGGQEVSTLYPEVIAYSAFDALTQLLAF